MNSTANMTSREVKVPIKTVALSVGGTDCLHAWEANNFLSRLRGLHGVPPLQMGEALIIKPCNAIHTLTMRFPIDVAFIDATGLVRRACSVPRFRFVRCQEACAVIEMPEGELNRLGIGEGQQIHRDKGYWT